MITRLSIDDPGSPGPGAVSCHDGMLAERAWRNGDVVAAIAAADRALASGADPEARAAGVAAAAAAADGALLDAAERWRGVAAALDGPPAAWAAGRAALAAGLAGDRLAAMHDLRQARDRQPDPTPRGLAVLLAGIVAVVDALGGGVGCAARRLTGLAATAVPADPLAADRWDELAVTLLAAGGEDQAALLVLGGQLGHPTSRHQLLTAWLRLRTGQLAEAREALIEAARTPVLRRNAVLGAAVTVGLARRSGNAHAMATTWQRVAPVVAGADVEPFLLDAWGELSVGAQQVSAAERDMIVEGIRAAVLRAGSPWWAVAAELRWAAERAIADGAAPAVVEIAERLTDLAATPPAAANPTVTSAALATAAWAQVLAGRVRPAEVTAAVTGLSEAGRRWEAAALCRAAVARTDGATARKLAGTGRTLRSAPAPGRSAGVLSGREREVGALVIDGLTHKEIGARLYLSPKTVEQHVARLRQKLAASNRAALVASLRACLDAEA